MINQVVSGDSREKELNHFYVIYEEMHAILCPKPFEGMKTLIGQLHKKCNSSSYYGKRYTVILH